MSKIVFSGGGSLGHITPSVAVWQQWLKRHPQDTCLFVCANRPDETELLTGLKLPFVTSSSPRLRWNFVFVFIKALWQNWQILRKFAPDVVFSKGGFISVPTCVIARLRGIPIIIHESDAVSGRANRFIRYIAQKVCYGLPRQSYGKKQVFTGNPVRSAMYSGSKEAGLAFTGLSGSKPILLITGGSQGSQALNEAVWNQLNELLEMFEVVHITGRGKLNVPEFQSSSDPEPEISNFQPPISNPQIPGYFATDFVTRELSDLYAIANVALTRASASTIAEMQANTITMLLCPLRGVGHDHQQKNALVMQSAGLADVVQQVDLGTELQSKLQALSKQFIPKNTESNFTEASSKICEQIEQYILRAND